jgi:glycosyltransferase involved in cell wall biosynthesis
MHEGSVRTVEAPRARVGLVVACKTHYPPTNGSSVHVYQLWHRLQSMGYEVFTWGRHSVAGDREYPQTASGLADLMKDVDLLYVRFPFSSSGFSLTNMARLLLKRRLPVVCEVNGPLYQLTHEWPRWRLWTLRNWVTLHGRHHLLMRFAVDHAICTCKELEQYVRSEFGVRNVSVLPDGGDPELFRPELREEGRAAMGLQGDDFVVFWAGGTEFWWQGIGRIMEVARRFDDHSIRFVIAGDPTHLPKPLPPNVTALGLLSYFDLPRYIAGADVCLCTYEKFDWCPIGFTGSPMKLFDYMSCGRPVIASSMGQICEVVRDGQNGLLTDGAVEDIAEKIQSLRREPQARDAMGRAARETVVGHYNWQNVAERTHSILSELLHDADTR